MRIRSWRPENTILPVQVLRLNTALLRDRRFHMWTDACGPVTRGMADPLPGWHRIFLLQLGTSPNSMNFLRSEAPTPIKNSTGLAGPCRYMGSLTGLKRQGTGGHQNSCPSPFTHFQYWPSSPPWSGMKQNHLHPSKKPRLVKPMDLWRSCTGLALGQPDLSRRMRPEPLHPGLRPRLER